MKLSVECYSGRKADERSARFWLRSNGLIGYLRSMAAKSRFRKRSLIR